MQLLKKSKLKKPKVSLILLDWNVRESFHICHYLSQQTTSRENFEIVVLEYYSKLTPTVDHYQKEIDTLALLEMPENSYYHKHLMYNVGFLLSQGDLIVICDSDAMVKPTFIETIIRSFDENPSSVLHLDQFRNHRRDFYPFSYPTFEDVIGYGCINIQDEMTTGVVEMTDRLHRRNYGACFCCRREDYLSIGGSDEHIDFVGHICGPYDLTFRLMNSGKDEIWHKKEFLYHTWHPGSDGVGEYLGPHDGYNLSTTSLEALFSGRTAPHVSHPLILKLQNGTILTEKEILNEAVNETHLHATSTDLLHSPDKVKNYAEKTYLVKSKTAPPSRLSKWKKFCFKCIILLQKTYSLITKQLPKFIKKIRKTTDKTQRQWETFSRATAYHYPWWQIISRLYSKKRINYVIVNTPRDLCLLSEFIRLKSKLSLHSHHQIELLSLPDIDDKKIDELHEKGQNNNLYITRASQYDWMRTEKLKTLKVEMI